MQTRFGSDSERYRFARPTDIDAIVEMLEDAEVGEWLWFVPAPASFLRGYFQPLIDTQWQDLANAAAPGTAVFIVEDADGAFLGQGAVVAVEGSVGGYEIGYQLPKASWGRGIGTRFAEFLAVWAVKVHGAHRLQAGLLDGNAGSRRILEKLGMTVEGTRPEFRLKGDVRHTELEFGMLTAGLDPKIVERTEARVEFEG